MISIGIHRRSSVLTFTGVACILLVFIWFRKAVPDSIQHPLYGEYSVSQLDQIGNQTLGVSSNNIKLLMRCSALTWK